MDLGPNAARFTGFAELYDRVRPTPPAALAEQVCAYAGMERAGLVVDLGSGSGLSSRWCARWADTVIGVEPSGDMRSVAEATTPEANVEYRPGWSDATGLPDASADVVVAVQALHWMEPAATFAEVARILRPGGVFVATDCDWPPSVGDVEAEQAWQACRAVVKVYEERLAAGLVGEELWQPIELGAEPALPDHFFRDPNRDRTMAVGVKAWSKDEHLRRMRESGRFRWCTEVALQQREQGDAERFIGLFRSQGDLQTLLKHGGSEDTLGVTAFAATARERLGDAPRPFWFTYRARLGVVG